jgi:CubicO group peptidase (beta-lactamase class C family)
MAGSGHSRAGTVRRARDLLRSGTIAGSIEEIKRRCGLRSWLGWAGVGLLVAAVLVVSHDPPYWLSRWGLQVHESGGLPRYLPRAVLRGGNQPPAPRVSPAEEQLDVAALQAAAAYAEQQRSTALIVARHGYIVYEKYWQGSNLDTVIDSQGLGRVVAALATGVALAERKIGWPDEPAGYLIRPWKDDARGQITIRNLLHLSSGLGTASSAAGAPNPIDLPLGAQPGTRWLDQSADSDLLGLILHNATGEPYTTSVSRAIWARIGAGEASVWLDAATMAPHVDVGFFARQGDWLRVGELLLNGGNYQGDEVIGPRWVPELLRPSKANPNYGAYLRLGTHPAPGSSPYLLQDVFVVQGGGNRMWVLPSLKMVILRTGAPSGDWDDSRIPNLIVRGARDFVPAPARPATDIRSLVPNH